jgi:hypothetical protein
MELEVAPSMLVQTECPEQVGVSGMVDRNWSRWTLKLSNEQSRSLRLLGQELNSLGPSDVSDWSLRVLTDLGPFNVGIDRNLPFLGWIHV